MRAHLLDANPREYLIFKVCELLCQLSKVRIHNQSLVIKHVISTIHELELTRQVTPKIVQI